MAPIAEEREQTLASWHKPAICKIKVHAARADSGSILSVCKLHSAHCPCLVQGHHCASLHEACLRRGLLDDDSEWDRCMEEAAAFQLPPQLRALFVCLLSMNSPAEPGRLWVALRDSMCQDFLLDARRVSYSPSLQCSLAF